MSVCLKNRIKMRFFLFVMDLLEMDCRKNNIRSKKF